MGQTTSTPLSLTLSHWPEARTRAQNLSHIVKKSKLQTLCSSEWPTFQVNWPPEGSFSLPLILQVKAVIYRPRPQGHPDMEPYILTWQDLCKNPPPRLKVFLPPPVSSPLSTPPLPVLALKAPIMPPILPKSPLPKSQNLLFVDPPPYPPMPGPQPFPPPRPVPFPGSPPLQGSAPSPDSTSPAVSPASNSLAAPAWGPATRTRGRRAQSPDDHAEDKAVILPLWPYGPDIPDKTKGRMPTRQYWPFSSSDLYNWKK